MEFIWNLFTYFEKYKEYSLFICESQEKIEIYVPISVPIYLSKNWDLFVYEGIYLSVKMPVSAVVKCYDGFFYFFHKRCINCTLGHMYLYLPLYTYPETGIFCL